MANERNQTLEVVDSQIAWVLDHSDISSWLKDALRRALVDDPVTAGNNAEMLRILLQSRAGAWVHDQLKEVARGDPGQLATQPERRS